MVTLLTTYLPVSAALTNFSYLPSDQTAYTATSAAGQRGTLFVPVGTPADYPRVYGGDRKSTRLNSSHSSISYAVFCLKKKKTKKKRNNTQYTKYKNNKIDHAI